MPGWYTKLFVLFYRRYVDDTFCLLNEEHYACLFFDYIKTRHPNIRFTMKKEINKKLLFLDILIDNNNSSSLITNVFRKNCDLYWSPYQYF